MKKYTLLLFICSITLISSAQTQSGKIVYKVDPPEHFLDTIGKGKTGEADPFFKKEWKKTLRAAPYLEFTLVFNQTQSSFKAEEQMINDNGVDLNLAGMVAGVEGVYYTDISEQVKIHQNYVRQKNWLIKSSLADVEWKIHSEKKKIKGYTCQKATANVALNSEVDGEITAWFSSDIPFQFGPIGLGGLPGMILGLERNHFYFYADEINLSSSKKTIHKPTKGKSISRKEMDKITRKNPYE